jgi:hypothetical protein
MTEFITNDRLYSVSAQTQTADIDSAVWSGFELNLHHIITSNFYEQSRQDRPLHDTIKQYSSLVV